MATKRLDLPGLKLLDFSDRDLMFALEEAGDDERWATSKEVADQIGIKAANPNQCVGSRFAWLRRETAYLETRVEDGDRLWRLSDMGMAILHSQGMNKTLERALAGLSEGQRIRVTEEIARMVRSGNKGSAFLTKRAWRRQTTVA